MKKSFERSSSALVFLTRVVSAFLPLIISAELACAQQNSARDQNTSDGEIHIWPVRGNLYMLVGAGSNVTVSAGKDGMLIVDSGKTEMSDKLLAAIRRLAKQLDPTGPPVSIRYIINTSAGADHTGGNAKLAESEIYRPLEGGEAIIAHHNVLVRVSNDPAVPFRARPTDTYITEQYRVNRFFNGEGVQIVHIPAAHTDGDSIVYFRYSDVISAGDVFTNNFPVIDIEKGGSVQGLIDGLNRLIDMVFPEFRSQGGTMLIPGHGRLSDLTDLAYYRDMVTIVRDRIQDLLQKGMSLAQVKAARPTLDYDPIYGKTPGSTDQFVEAVYRSLSQKPR
jgi:glyoxylase-like metal-dependent hydrolase (beta-lactamase superfamily II)